MRINRYLAQCGVASRRECDRFVEEGRVAVNGETATPGLQVSSSDDIRVDGKAVAHKKNEYYIVNKPKGYICSVSDDKGRKTVMDLLPKGVGRVYPVGRLDYDSEGLLILTTDGDLAQRLTSPIFEIPKTYTVKVKGTLTEDDLNPIRSGMEIERGVVTKKCKAHIIETNSAYTKVNIVLVEGKNREIRKMFERLGRDVLLLKRTKIGELTLSGVDRGGYRKLTDAEVEYLKNM